MHRLTEHGLVKRVPLNRGYLFALNSNHVAAEAVKLLMNLRSELFERIRSAIEEWEIAPVHASVFGSAARGDGDVGSDIDVLIVRPRGLAQDEPPWQTRVDALRDQIESWTGNRANIVDRSEAQLAELVERQRPIIDELRSDAIVVGGRDVTTLLELV